MTQSIPMNEALEELSTVRDFIRWAVTEFNQAELVYGHGTENGWDESVNLVLTSLQLPPDIDNNVLDAKILMNEKRLIVFWNSRRMMVGAFRLVWRSLKAL